VDSSDTIKENLAIEAFTSLTSVRRTLTCLLASSGRCFEVEMVMQRATGIEVCPALRTRSLAIQILTNRQLDPAGAAEHCLLGEFSLQPNLGGMPGFELVAVKAGIIGQAAFELYGDDVQLAAIVRAASTRIYVNSSYENSGNPEFHVTLPQNLDYKAPRLAGRIFSCPAGQARPHPR
jgi:hypothetical protein